jgi:hypothetical protein
MSSEWDRYLASGIQVAPGGTHQNVSFHTTVIIADLSLDHVPNRKEIRTLSEIELHLYVKGLAIFMDQPKTDPLSYFQIAGRSSISRKVDFGLIAD